MLVVTASLFVFGCVLFFQYTPNAFRWPLRVLWLAAIGWLVVTAVRAVRKVRFTGRNIAFIAVLGCFYYVVLTFVCHVFIKLMSQRDDRLTGRGMSTLAQDCRLGIQAVVDDSRFAKFDREIGWVPRPNYVFHDYTVNSQGIRSRHEYATAPADAIKRILCMGDSFTFGVAVKDDESYPAQAEKMKPGTEWINFGIPGGCLVQSYKRYMRQARDFGGKHVVIGFMTNDAQRTVNVFRPFVNADSGFPLTKPFAKYENGKFTIEPNPYSSTEDLRRLLADDRTELKKLVELDYLKWSRQGSNSMWPIGRTLCYVWDALRVDKSTDVLLDRRLPLSKAVKSMIPVDPYGRAIWEPAGNGFRAICAMFKQYRDQIIADGRNPLLVIIPGPNDVSDYRKQYERQYGSLIDFFRANEWEFIDFLDPLVSKHKDNLSTEAIFVDNHYQPQVNKELAEEIIKALKLP